MKQNEAPVEFPVHVLVGTSRYGERSPPRTLPYGSRTGWPSFTSIGSACGGGVPWRTHWSRLRNAASKKMWLGKRLRGPSLQSIGGTLRPAFSMSAGAAGEDSPSGGAGPAAALLA